MSIPSDCKVLFLYIIIENLTHALKKLNMNQRLTKLKANKITIHKNGETRIGYLNKKFDNVMFLGACINKFNNVILFQIDSTNSTA